LVSSNICANQYKFAYTIIAIKIA